MFGSRVADQLIVAWTVHQVEDAADLLLAEACSVEDQSIGCQLYLMACHDPIIPLRKFGLNQLYQLDQSWPFQATQLQRGEPIQIGEHLNESTQLINALFEVHLAAHVVKLPQRKHLHLLTRNRDVFPSLYGFGLGREWKRKPEVLLPLLARHWFLRQGFGPQPDKPNSLCSAILSYFKMYIDIANRKLSMHKRCNICQHLHAHRLRKRYLLCSHLPENQGQGCFPILLKPFAQHLIKEQMREQRLQWPGAHRHREPSDRIPLKMSNQDCEIVKYLFLLCENAIIFMLMRDIPAQREGNAGL